MDRQRMNYDFALESEALEGILLAVPVSLPLHREILFLRHVPTVRPYSVIAVELGIPRQQAALVVSRFWHRFHDEVERYANDVETEMAGIEEARVIYQSLRGKSRPPAVAEPIPRGRAWGLEDVVAVMRARR